MNTKKTGDTEVIAENTKKTEQKPRAKRTYNRKTVSNSDEKNIQEKVSDDNRSTKSIVKSVTRRGKELVVERSLKLFLLVVFTK